MHMYIYACNNNEWKKEGRNLKVNKEKYMGEFEGEIGKG